MSKREICDHAKRLPRQRDTQDVGFDHFGKVRTQPIRKQRIELDRDNARARTREGSGQHTGAGAEVEHELARPSSGRANDRRRECAIAEKMLPARGLSRANGHGPSPSS